MTRLKENSSQNFDKLHVTKCFCVLFGGWGGLLDLFLYFFITSIIQTDWRCFEQNSFSRAAEKYELQYLASNTQRFQGLPIDFIAVHIDLSLLHESEKISILEAVQMGFSFQGQQSMPDVCSQVVFRNVSSHSSNYFLGISDKYINKDQTQNAWWCSSG